MFIAIRFVLSVALLASAVPGSLRLTGVGVPQRRETVPVYVTVADQSGSLVTDLTREDFEVYDNGKRQTIKLFESGVQPITS